MLSPDTILGSNGFYSHWTLPAFLTAQQETGVRRIAFHHVPAHLWLDHYRCVGAETLKQHLAEAGIAVDVFHPAGIITAFSPQPEPGRIYAPASTCAAVWTSPARWAAPQSACSPMAL